MLVDAPSGIVKWYSHNLVGTRSLYDLKASLTGKRQPDGSQKTSYVKLSDKEADQIIENIKKDPEGFPVFDEANAPDKREEYQKWLVERYLKFGKSEEKVENIEENKVDDLISPIQDQPEPKGALTLYEGKRDTDLVDEEIDERILNLLGLEDVFDVDYGTYKTLLREKLAEGRITGKELPRKEDELLVEEFRRIKSKVGRFKIKRKTITNDIDVGETSAIVKTSKLLPSSIISEKDSDRTKDIRDIEKLLDSILLTIGNQNKEQKKKLELNRKESEAKRRELKEESLEKGFDKAKSILSKVIAPFQSLIDKIQRFLFFTILGRAFKLFMDWASDPNNKKKLETIGRFLKDWWPSLLGAWFFFANPLGRFIRTIIGSVAKLTLRLAKFAIPKLLNFVKANPVAAIAVTGAVAAGAGEMWRQKEEKTQVAKEAEKRNVEPKVVQKELDTAKSSPFAMFGEGMSNIGGYNRGGNIFSGIVGKNDGTRVSGAGQDTQFFPVEGGGGAVLAPNELVLTEEQQSKIQEDTGVHPASYVAGVQPKKLSGNINPMSSGGIVGYKRGGMISKFKDGGIIGMKGGGNTKVRAENPNMNSRGIEFSLGSRTTTYPLSRSIQDARQRLLDRTALKNTNIRNNYKPWWERINPFMDKSGFADRLPSHDPSIRNYNMPGYNRNRWFELYNFRARPEEYKTTPNPKQKEKFRYAPTYVRPGIDKPLTLQGGGIVPQGPFTPLPYPGYSRPQGSFIPKPILSLPGPMPGTTVPFGYNPFKGLKGGGLIKENTGYNIPGATADRQYLPPMAVQPGEAHYIIPKDAVDRGAVPIVDYIVAKLDPNSNPRNQGRGLLSPPTKSNIVSLPPEIIKSASTVPNRPAPGTQVPTFFAYRKTNERYESMKTYTLRSSMIGSGVM